MCAFLQVRTSPLQLVQRDRQVAHALAGGVIDRVGDRRRDPDDADLANALDSERIDDRVRLLDEDHLDVVYVGIHFRGTEQVDATDLDCLYGCRTKFRRRLASLPAACAELVPAIEFRTTDDRRRFRAECGFFYPAR
jgi:hypothetical protein